MKKKWLEELDLTISSLTLTVLFILTIIGVIFRYLLNNPLVWLEEIQIILVVWTVFLGASAAFRLQAHMSMEFVHEKLSEKGQRILNIVITAITVVVLAYFGFNAIRLIILYAGSNRMSAILRIHPALMYGIVPVGCALMIYHDLVALISGAKKHQKSEEEF